jgi:hypothetical protein
MGYLISDCSSCQKQSFFLFSCSKQMSLLFLRTYLASRSHTHTHTHTHSSPIKARKLGPCPYQPLILGVRINDDAIYHQQFLHTSMSLVPNGNSHTVVTGRTRQAWWDDVIQSLRISTYSRTRIRSQSHVTYANRKKNLPLAMIIMVTTTNIRINR